MTKPFIYKHGLKLNVLIGLSSVIASHSENTAPAQTVWPDLTFRPHADQSGSLMEPGQWREAVNPLDWVQQT